MMMIRTFTLSLAALALTACGFTPMHSPSAAGTTLRDISVQLDKGSDVADNQAGFFITQRLRDRIGVDGERYRLELTPGYRRSRLGIRDDDVASRYDVTLRSRYELYDAKTGELLDKGSVSSITTFGAPSGPFGVITADDQGTRQAAQEVADRLVVELAKYFANQPAP